ncbi:MAG: phosphatidylglycerophosphatase A [Oligoflexales bacterium]|nr:phosphatidylglycerophosphatase A [Oligoflexales bacterium]
MKTSEKKTTTFDNKAGITPSRSGSEKIAIFLATGLGTGYLPKAPGTWGSILGLAVAFGLHRLFVWAGLFIEAGETAFGLSTLEPSHRDLAIVVLTIGSLVSFLLALKTISVTERSWRLHDDKRIVIDEVLGQMLACLWFQPSFFTWGLSFVLFRFLDIVKPGPIRWIDRQKSSLATLMDDVVAGGLSALILRLALP